MAERVWSLAELADLVSGRVVGDPDVALRGVAPIEAAAEGEITFLANLKYTSWLERTGASAIVVSPRHEAGRARGNLLVHANPYLAWARICGLFHTWPYQFQGVSPQAMIDPTAEVDPGATIYPLAFVGPRCRVGRGTIIFPHVFLGDGCEVGEESILYPNVSVLAGCRIGSGVIIHSGSTIGSDGYGFAPERSGGPYHKVPQMGIVVIEDGVEIGAGVTIDRAALGVTRIGRGTKIDNLVQIGHNVEVGEDCLLVAQVGISGSTRLGRSVVLAGKVGVVGHITIGDGVVVGAMSGVTKDLPPGGRFSGLPAREHGQWLRAQSVMGKLPELVRRVRGLEERLNRLAGEPAVGREGSNGEGEEGDGGDGSGS
ncbi:MAG: UDP-3-O-(3-hydroxymyristoyl)glucosamine N-acyltransferase [Pseudomonadota bacterium]